MCNLAQWTIPSNGANFNKTYMKKLLREFPKKIFRKFLDEFFNESPR
jgi:hypothetical protein